MNHSNYIVPRNEMEFHEENMEWGEFYLLPPGMVEPATIRQLAVVGRRRSTA